MKITYAIALLLTLIMIAVNLTEVKVPPFLEGTLVSIPIGASPLEKELYFDWPEAYTLIDKITARYGVDVWEHPNEIPPEYLKEAADTPIWLGFFPKLLGYNFPPAPWFEKISQGEVWRLFTPALLHTELFHLCFNLFWLIALGRLVEERIGGTRYILLSLLLGIGSNTAQYLMTGMRFIGYSGVLTGLFGFAYMDQKRGAFYPFPPSVFKSMSIFIFGIAALETLLIFSPWKFSISVANTAHISGLFLGIFLGRLPRSLSKEK